MTQGLCVRVLLNSATVKGHRTNLSPMGGFLFDFHWFYHLICHRFF